MSELDEYLPEDHADNAEIEEEEEFCPTCGGIWYSNWIECEICKHEHRIEAQDWGL